MDKLTLEKAKEINATMVTEDHHPDEHLAHTEEPLLTGN